MYNQLFHVLKCSDETLLALLKVRSLTFFSEKSHFADFAALRFTVCSFRFYECTIYNFHYSTYIYILGAKLVNANKGFMPQALIVMC